MALKDIKHLQVITTEALYTLDVAVIGLLCPGLFPWAGLRGTVLTISMTKSGCILAFLKRACTGDKEG